MRETDPGETHTENTAGEMGAHRLSVGEAVPPDESGSLNVPPKTQAGPVRGDVWNEAAEGAEPAVPATRGKAVPESLSAPVTGEETGEEPRRRGPSRLLLAAAGTVAVLVFRALRKRRAKGGAKRA
ncbi:hypothetical protein [Spongiactinospora sp. TRM90649]|uniref:hypothetical protein n=1 Tax=Spongiactinospora sp. TRM90649 TaxID=3031114 RepID=UPI0023F8C4A1|nr:hypothetical protein [Spongiactinospora sp. TRM90649]MDF5752304.1 hypothetical protein [Spongiactinospora sp. TRM90649]